jgi:hypothetical protein
MLQPVNAPAGVAVACSVVVAAVGAYFAAGMVADGHRAATLRADSSLAPRTPAAIAQDVRTSFGVVAVEGVTRSAGPTARALAGVTHGIQSLVAPDKIQVNAAVTLTNLGPGLARYSPTQFELLATRGRKPSAGDRPVRVARASVAPGTLQPSASVDATLTYVVPRKGSKLWLAFRDRGNPTPILFDLGRLDRTPRGATDNYPPHGH